MEGLDHWGYWPSYFSVPEQHQIWRIGEDQRTPLALNIVKALADELFIDVPLPDGLHLCVEPCWMGCEEREEPSKHQKPKVPGGWRYILQISKPMTLQGELCLKYVLNNG